MKKFLFSLPLCILTILLVTLHNGLYIGEAASRVAPQLKWVQTYSNLYGYCFKFSDIKVDTSGNVYTVGYCPDSLGPSRVTIKYNNMGQLQWAQVYGHTATGFTGYGKKIVLDTSGNVYVPVNNGATGELVKYDPNGNVVWVYPVISTGVIYDISIDTQANIYTLAQNLNNYPDNPCQIRKISSTGQGLWRKETPKYFGGQAITAVGSSVFTTGSIAVFPSTDTLSTTSDSDIATLKYDSNGQLLWLHQYSGPGSGIYSESGTKIISDPQGDIYVIGYSDGNNGFLGTALKYNALSGTPIWTYTYNVTSLGGFTDVAIDNQGNIFVIGLAPPSNNFSSPLQPYTIKLNSLGQIVWIKIDDTNYAWGWESRQVQIDPVSGKSHCYICCQPFQPNEHSHPSICQYLW